MEVSEWRHSCQIVKHLVETGLIPTTMAWMHDDQIKPFMNDIIEAEINFWYKIKDKVKMKEIDDKFFDDDVKAGRLVKATNEPPEGMYH